MAASRKRQKRMPGAESRKVEEKESQANRGLPRKSDNAATKAQERLAIRAAEEYSAQAKKGSTATGKIKSSGESERAAKSISTFFTAPNVRHQTKARRSFPSSEHESSPNPPTQVDDEIFDDDLDTDALLGLQLPEMAPQPKKESFGYKQTTQSSARGFKVPQSLRLLDSPSTRSYRSSVVTRPWSDSHAPTIVEDLAINKKKVAEVQAWLHGAISDPRSQRMLVVKGPTGAGKSTTLRVLAKHLDLQVFEWSDPLGFAYSSDVNRPVSVQFEDFIHRATSYGSLNPSDGSKDGKQEDGTSFQPFNRGLVLIEDLSSICFADSSSPPWFASTLLEFLSRDNALCPVVLVISDSAINTSEHRSQNISTRRLLGHEILEHELVTFIDFNAVASSFMIKALHRIMNREIERFRGSRKPTTAYLKHLSQVGDIRSALNTLEMSSISGWQNGHLDCNVDPDSASAPAERSNKTLSQGIDHRETQLNLFHAVGKVVYNKRYEPSTADLSPEVRPEHRAHRDKVRYPETSADELIASVNTDLTTFVSALHENYVPSCSGDIFQASLEGCSDFLSDSEILHACLQKVSRKGQSDVYDLGASRMRDISTQVAVRGMLFSLPDPVTRSVSRHGEKARSQSSDVFRMFYPESSRIYQRIEETLESVQQWLRSIHSANIKDSGTALANACDFVQVLPAQKTLIVEQLPYLRQISGFRGKTPSQSLEQIAIFNGKDGPLHTNMARNASRSDAPRSDHGPGPKSMHPPSLDDDVTALYLSDDDIEDD